MKTSKVCLVFLGVVLALSMALGLPTLATAAPITVAVTPTAGMYTPPPDFVSSLGSTAGAEAVIGFDTITSGGNSVTVPNDTPITTQYLASNGVQFGLVGSSTSGNLVAKTANSMDGGYNWGDDSITEPNTLASWNTVVSGAAPVVKITFIPQGNQMLPRAAGLVFTDSPYNDVFTLSAYTSAGTLIGTVTSNTADMLYNSTGHAEDCFMGFQYYDASDPTVGIGYLEYTMAANAAGSIIGNEIDNVTYESRIGAPEPATMALLGMGSVLLIRRRLRRRCSR